MADSFGAAATPLTGSGGGPGQAAGGAQGYAHPLAALFHVAFKLAALLVYVFFGWFGTESFVLNFLLVVLLSAVDFWTVKNVSGRLLVGLRWWNEVKEDGTSAWVYESGDEQKLAAMNPNDGYVFWTALYVAPVCWAVFAVLNLLRLSFDYLLIVSVAFVLTGSNALGYTYASRDAKNKIQGRLQGMAQGAVLNSLRSAMGFGAAQPAQPAQGRV